VPAVSSGVEKPPQIPPISLALRPNPIRHPNKCSKLKNDAICGLGRSENIKDQEPSRTLSMVYLRHQLFSDCGRFASRAYCVKVEKV
jgi:hypothetical protein